MDNLEQKANDSIPVSFDRDGPTQEVKSRIVREIEEAIARARENPSMYDKGSYYKYGKIGS